MTAKEFIETNIDYLEEDPYQFCMFMYNDLDYEESNNVVYILKSLGVDLQKERECTIDIATATIIHDWKASPGSVSGMPLMDFVYAFFDNYLGFTPQEITEIIKKRKDQYPSVEITTRQGQDVIDLRF